MRNLLINFGCSFSYGEGLEFHLWKDIFPSLYKTYKGKTNYFPCNIIAESIKDFSDFRENNRYNGILKNFLDLGLVGRFENGGCNYQNIEKLEILIKHFRIEKNLVPKYCVFQFTNVIRDIVAFCHNPFGLTNLDDGVKWVGEDKKKQLVDNLYLIDDSINRHKLNEIVSEVFIIIFNKLIECFDKLEEMDCKCVFFMGLEDKYSYELIEPTIKSSKYFVPIIFNGREYRSWDYMNRECYLTLRHNIDINDDHPCLDSHKWMANLLYKKYLQLQK